MPEDASWYNTGFLFFEDDQQSPIANEAAVRKASVHLMKPPNEGSVLEHLEQATEAVQAAARKKTLREALDDGPDVPNVVDGEDFFL